MSSKNKASKSHSKKHSKKHNKDDSSESETAIQRLNIVVYRGNPVDVHYKRHTAFFIEYEGGDTLLSHVTGGARHFRHRDIQNPRHPTASQTFAKMFAVASFQVRHDEVNLMRIRNELQAVPVNNDDNGWNCQSWIGDALERLLNVGLLTAEKVQIAADNMADAIMEATVEEEN